MPTAEQFRRFTPRRLAAPARLDAYLDALAEGRPADPTGLDPALVATAERLHHAAGLPATPRLRVLAPGQQRGKSGRRGRHLAVLPPRTGVLGSVATAAVLVLTLALGLLAAALGSSPSSTPAPGGSGDEIFVTDPFGQPISVLDPETLADRPLTSLLLVVPPVATPPAPGSGAVRSVWLASTDGATRLRLDVSVPANAVDQPWHLVLRDAATGAERCHIDESAYLMANSLSADGSRLVLLGNLYPPLSWFVYDTRTCAQLGGGTSAEAGLAAFDATLSPDGRRLYRLVLPGMQPRGFPFSPPGTYPIELVAYDVVTGREVGRLDLGANFAAATWITAQTIENGRAVAFPLQPGVAVSPDGTKSVLVAGNGTQISVVTTATMTVERRIALPPDITALARSWLPPSGTPAVSAEQTRPPVRWSLAFSPDGRSVYLFGVVLPGAPMHAASAGTLLPLLRIDLATGQVRARDRRGGVILGVSADGRSLYVYSAAVLRRLDAATLQTLAERQLPDGSNVVVWPPAAVG